MIRSFNTLSEQEQEKLFAHVLALKPEAFLSLEAMQKAYLGVPYNQGETQFSFWESGKVIGSLALVTKEVETKGEAFIHAVFVPEKASYVLTPLLQQAFESCPVEGLSSIKLGLPPNREDLATVARAKGFQSSYSMLEMGYRGSEEAVSTPSAFRYEGLTSANSSLFRKIINAAFENSQNGAILTDEEVAELVTENASGLHMGICFLDEQPFGVYQVTIAGQKGWIDTIGLHPDFQGQGLGALILKHCLDLLAGLAVKLTVVSTNISALRLYRRNGFEVDATIGAWFELPIVASSQGARVL